jgi:phosphate transport system protein
LTRFAEQPDGERPARREGAGPGNVLNRDLAKLRRRVLRSANVATDMLEGALHALWSVDHAVAADVRSRDDVVDAEEVQIERECLRLLTLQRPYGQDFRLITFCLKANADIERVADHATSIAKITLKLDPVVHPVWPTALTELGDRVPVMCHTLMRAVLDEDLAAARALVENDRVIDGLDDRLFDEVTDWVTNEPSSAEAALLCARLGRELERVGDLMVNIAEDVVYLVTGEIVRHQKPKNRRLAEGA